MEYKKINIKKYLLFYLIITIITFGTVFILKIIDKNKKEIIATQIENSRQNNIITDNLIDYMGKVVNWHTIIKWMWGIKACYSDKAWCEIGNSGIKNYRKKQQSRGITYF